MAPRVAIILQARVASTRLPSKALAGIGGTTLLARCLHRLTLARAGQVVLATTEAPEDDALAEIARVMKVDVYRGSTDDVLGRYLAASQAIGAEVIIRATGDNPAVNIGAPARLLRALQSTTADYACEGGLPYGAGLEAVTVSALVRAAAGATAPDDREHVTLYVKRRPGAFRVTRRPAPRPLQKPDLRLTVDTPEDLDYMRRLFASVTPPEPSLAQLIAASARCSRSDAA